MPQVGLEACALGAAWRIGAVVGGGGDRWRFGGEGRRSARLSVGRRGERKGEVKGPWSGRRDRECPDSGERGELSRRASKGGAPAPVLVVLVPTFPVTFTTVERCRVGSWQVNHRLVKLS